MFFLKKQELPVKGYLLVVTLVSANLLLWLVTLNSNPLFFVKNQQLYGEILGSTALTLLFSVVLLASRLKFLEQFFGGLDRMYVVHRHLALVTIALAYIHSRIISDLPDIKEGVAGSLGGTSLDLMLYLSIWALFPRICNWLSPLYAYVSTKYPSTRHKLISVFSSERMLTRFLRGAWSFLKNRYRPWLVGHKLMWGAFFLGTAHALTVESYAHEQPLLLSFYIVITITGLTAFGLKYFGNIITKTRVKYSVEQILRPSNDTMMITMAPTGAALRYHSGQFAFLKFPMIRGLNDPHPFTITSNPSDPKISMTIKACGNFTRRLQSSLAVGEKALVEGGYGCFDYTKGGRKQIWIAGGIGITPFVSWLNSFDPTFVDEIDFFYSIKNRNEYLHAEALDKWNHPSSVKVHVLNTSEEQRLSVATIFNKCELPHNRDFFLCGPEQMVDSLYEQLLKEGIKEKKIHYEFFQFR